MTFGCFYTGLAEKVLGTLGSTPTERKSLRFPFHTLIFDLFSNRTWQRFDSKSRLSQHRKRIPVFWNKFYFVFALLGLGGILGCDQYLEGDEFLKRYEETCVEEKSQGSILFKTMVISADYYRARWEMDVPDSSWRILLHLDYGSSDDPLERMAKDPILGELSRGYEQYSSKSREYLNGLLPKFRLIHHQDTLRPLSYRLARHWGLSNGRSLMLLFPSDQESEIDAFSLHVDDFGDFTGNISLDLRSCTNLKFRKGEP